MASQPPEFTLIGKITRPQGLRGEVRILPETMDINRFFDLKEVFVGEMSTDKRTVERVWKKKQMIVLKLSGCESFEDADKLRGLELKVPTEERITLSDDAYFWDDLLGMVVVSDEGCEIGEVKRIFPTGSNDVLVIQKGGREVLLPFTGDVILDVNVEEKKMLVHILEGLVNF